MYPLGHIRHIRLHCLVAVRDWGVVTSVVILSVFGLTAVSSLYAGTGDARPLKHAAAVVLGIICMLAIGRFRSHQVRALAPFAYALSIGMLVAVLLIGTEVRGTKGWIVSGPFSLQPVEFAKLGLVLMLAFYFERAHASAGPWEMASKSALIAVPVIGLTLVQPDAGSAVVLTAIWALVVFTQIGWRERIVLLLVACGVALSGWLFLFENHQRERVRVLIDPARDPFGAGYHIRQSIIAVGSGGLWGRGIGAGSQSQLQFLPEASTDFVFALIGEELGFVGALALLAAFAVLMGRLGGHLARAPDAFASLTVLGIGGWWCVQIFVYIGMNVGIAPVVGIPLPFVSYGGSALLSAFLAAGCVLAVAGESTVPRGA